MTGIGAYFGSGTGCRICRICEDLRDARPAAVRIRDALLRHARQARLTHLADRLADADPGAIVRAIWRFGERSVRDNVGGPLARPTLAGRGGLRRALDSALEPPDVGRRPLPIPTAATAARIVRGVRHVRLLFERWQQRIRIPAWPEWIVAHNDLWQDRAMREFAKWLETAPAALAPYGGALALAGHRPASAASYRRLVRRVAWRVAVELERPALARALEDAVRAARQEPLDAGAFRALLLGRPWRRASLARRVEAQFAAQWPTRDDLSTPPELDALEDLFLDGRCGARGLARIVGKAWLRREQLPDSERRRLDWLRTVVRWQAAAEAGDYPRWAGPRRLAQLATMATAVEDGVGFVGWPPDPFWDSAPVGRIDRAGLDGLARRIHGRGDVPPPVFTVPLEALAHALAEDRS